MISPQPERGRGGGGKMRGANMNIPKNSKFKPIPKTSMIPDKTAAVKASLNYTAQTIDTHTFQTLVVPDKSELK